uniref:Uncharacterized protein n=1 Tax=Ochrobactrum phage ORM_20 TaxID=2985243 RepID=A0A9N6WTN9_9VIRU|nr:hypothetical protein ORM20_00119 [Ochrobactrum phage ORM_20]
MHNISAEIGHPVGNFLDINYAPVRQLAGRPSGWIAFSDLRCKSRYIREPADGWYYKDDSEGKIRWKHDRDRSGRVEINWMASNTTNAGGNWSTTSVSPFGDGWTYHRGDLRFGGSPNHAWHSLARDRWN